MNENAFHCHVPGIATTGICIPSVLHVRLQCVNCIGDENYENINVFLPLLGNDRFE